MEFITFSGKHGLAGAAERMRNLVSQELDVVVSLKEAKQSCEQLLNDRKTLNKELADLKKKQRYTMTNDERAEMQSKIENLEGRNFIKFSWEKAFSTFKSCDFLRSSEKFVKTHDANYQVRVNCDFTNFSASEKLLKRFMKMHG